MKKLVKKPQAGPHRRGRWRDRLERWGFNPSYAGLLLFVLAIFFFGAATNTMAGWLYVMSGTIGAWLLVASVLARRSLRDLTVERRPIAPVSAGEAIDLPVIVGNPLGQGRSLLSVVDRWPDTLGPVVPQSIAQLPAGDRWRGQASIPGVKRGIYTWAGLTLRSAAPFGLVWARRDFTCPAKVVVYPQVFPLSRCPLLKTIGDVGRPLAMSDDDQWQAANEGLTRSLRPYRWGDSLRLVHWRTSARRGSLQVRELETGSHGPELILALDLAAPWWPEDFEQAAIAAASIYSYASRQSLDPWLWTATTGLIRGRQVILEALAGAQPGQVARDPGQERPARSILWLTGDPGRLASLPTGSYWLLWAGGPTTVAPQTSPATPASPVLTPIASTGGKIIHRDRPLISQLQEL